MELNSAQIAKFDDQGYLLLRGAVTGDRLGLSTRGPR